MLLFIEAGATKGLFVERLNIFLQLCKTGLNFNKFALERQQSMWCNQRVATQQFVRFVSPPRRGESEQDCGKPLIERKARTVRENRESPPPGSAHTQSCNRDLASLTRVFAEF